MHVQTCITVMICAAAIGCRGGTAQSAALEAGNMEPAAQASIAMLSDGGPAASATTIAQSPNAAPPSTPATLGNTTFTNPVSPHRADPGVLRTQGRYFLFTTNRDGDNVPAADSLDLVHWTSSPNDALPVLPSWASFGDTWAPEVAQIDPNRFVMYFTARHTASGKQCIGAAVATTPLGPYVPDSGDPLACQTGIGGSIDPSPYLDDAGVRWVVFKNDGNCCGNPVQLWLQRMAVDGTTPVNAPVALLRIDQSWEGNVIEAPFVWRHDDTYYLFYSGNAYVNDSYAIGYATSAALAGPYVKSAGPWVASSDTEGQVLGPGGQNVVQDDAGDAWLVYHTWLNTAYQERVLNLAPIVWDASGPKADVRFGLKEAGPRILQP